MPSWREGPFRWYLNERPAAPGYTPPQADARPGASARDAGSLWTPLADPAVPPGELLAPWRRVWALGDPDRPDGWAPVPDAGSPLHRALAAGWTLTARSEYRGDVVVELWERR
ncbi:hypothetical protein BJF78_28605 [Pseudonocardia sp. CNS-139]|nr:hypothetical protein BJF78_28605 [Pseudonocardia sp. CNS-139]